MRCPSMLSVNSARHQELGNLIERAMDGGIRARDPDLLLDAWREDYDFSKHDIVLKAYPARRTCPKAELPRAARQGQGEMRTP